MQGEGGRVRIGDPLDADRVSRTVHLGSLDTQVSPSQFVTFISSCGTVTQYHISGDTQRSSTFAFVEYQTTAGAAALLARSGHKLGRFAVQCNPSKKSIQFRSRDCDLSIPQVLSGAMSRGGTLEAMRGASGGGEGGAGAGAGSGPAEYSPWEVLRQMGLGEFFPISAMQAAAAPVPPRRPAPAEHLAPGDVNCTVHAVGIDSHLSEGELAAWLSECGTLKALRLCGDPRGPTLYGFFEFTSRDGAAAMVVRNHSELGKCRITTSWSREAIKQPLSPAGLALTSTTPLRESLVLDTGSFDRLPSSGEQADGGPGAFLAEQMRALGQMPGQWPPAAAPYPAASPLLYGDGSAPGWPSPYPPQMPWPTGAGSEYCGYPPEQMQQWWPAGDLQVPARDGVRYRPRSRSRSHSRRRRRRRRSPSSSSSSRGRRRVSRGARSPPRRRR
eukprot:TRINITY_DN2937_c7_g1_i1.p1 TRINITY_DN2937_c7_g1~~TRINITY_DN2937_c7_g1_i1.p1  ORF type:complete len:473 (+),score=118.50 TRINITY_DN2937_c7_g1_i1:91-1419(+)